MLRKMKSRFKDKQTRTFRPPPPACPEHGCAMVCRCTAETLRYYYCPVQGCLESVRKSKVNDIIVERDK